MRQSLALITPPTFEPITLAELKAWARIDDNLEDNLLNSLLISARQEAEKYLRSALVTQTWELTLDLCGSNLNNLLGEGTYDLPITALYGDLPNVIDLPYAPIQTISFVKTYDLNNILSTFSNTNYTLDIAGNRFMLNYGAVYPSNLRQKSALVIRYIAGYTNISDIPLAIKLAIMSYAQALYESRGICDLQADPLKELHGKLSSYRKAKI